jgi:hypothetical protein
MRSQHVTSRLAEIAGAISKANYVAQASGDPEVQAFFARYIVVFAAGIYEDCIEHLFVEFAKKNGNSNIALFFSKMLDAHFRNPHYNNLKGFLNCLNPNYGDQLDQMLVGTPGSKEALTSVITNKNEVAHGKPCTATLRDAEEYHTKALSVFDALENILGL